MYKIIGADQREYGPVNADQIREWIAKDRANGETRVKVGDSPYWNRLQELPEFVEALAAKAASASPPPPVPPKMIQRFKTEPQPVVSDAVFKIGDCFSRSWALYQANFAVLFGATAIMLIITIGLGSIHGVGWLAGAFLFFVLKGGLDFLFLKVIRGQPSDIGDAFCGFKARFLPLMLASLVAHVLTGIGFILLILPCIYLLTAWWMFTPLLIIDKGLDFWPAMELSRKTVNRHWWPCFGLFVVAGLVMFGGFLACGVGLFLTLPIAIGAIAYAYDALFGGPDEKTEIESPVPPPPKPDNVGGAPTGAPKPLEPEAKAAEPAVECEKNLGSDGPEAEKNDPESPVEPPVGR